jgi:hypothetical protein
MKDFEEMERKKKERIQKVKTLKPIIIEFGKKSEITVKNLKEKKEMNVEIKVERISGDKTSNEEKRDNIYDERKKEKDEKDFIKDHEKGNSELTKIKVELNNFSKNAERKELTHKVREINVEEFRREKKK